MPTWLPGGEDFFQMRRLFNCSERTDAELMGVLGHAMAFKLWAEMDLMAGPGRPYQAGGRRYW